MAEPTARGGTAARVARNAAWLTTARVGAKALALPLVILLARFLGPEEFGRWALLTSLVIILSNLADAGLSTLTVRDVAARPALARWYYRRSLAARLALSGLLGLGLLTWGLAGWGGSNPLWLWLLAGLLLLPEASLKAAQGILTARERMDLTSALSLFQAGAATLVCGGAVWAGGGLLGAAAGLGLVNLAAAATLARLTKPYLDGTTTDPRSLLRLLVAALPYGFSTLLAIIYFRIDVVMISALLGAEPAGQYSAALRLSDAALIIPAALGGALFPVMSRQLGHGDRVGLLISYTQAVRLLALLALPALAAVWFHRDWLIDLFFGPAYAQAGAILAVLALTWPFFFLNAPLGNLLAASEYMAKFVPWAAANTVLDVALNYLLIGADGPRGAAWATLICEVLGVGLQLHFVGRALGERPATWVHLGRPLLAAVGAGALWAWTSSAGASPWLALPAGLGLYGLILLAVGGLTRQDWDFLRRVASRWTRPETV